MKRYKSSTFLFAPALAFFLMASAFVVNAAISQTTIIDSTGNGSVSFPCINGDVMGSYCGYAPGGNFTQAFPGHCYDPNTFYFGYDDLTEVGIYPIGFKSGSWITCPLQWDIGAFDQYGYVQHISYASSTGWIAFQSHSIAGYSTSSVPFYLCSGMKRPTNIFDVVNGVEWAGCNLANWLFVPSDTSVADFQSVSDTFQGKAPFAYFFVVKNSFSSLSSSSTPAFLLSNSTGAFGTTIFQPLKTGLIWILWIVFGLWFIKRISKFDF